MTLDSYSKTAGDLAINSSIFLFVKIKTLLSYPASYLRLVLHDSYNNNNCSIKKCLKMRNIIQNIEKATYVEIDVYSI